MLASSLLLTIPKVAADGLLLNRGDVIIVEDLRAILLLGHFLHELEVTFQTLAL